MRLPDRLMVLVTGALISLGAALAPSSGGAIEIVFGDLTNGQTIVTVPGVWEAEAEGGTFQSKTVKEFTAVGISGGAVDGEIDVTGEAITFTFDEPQRLDEITVAFLFKAGEFGDQVSEVARMTISATPFIAGDLSVIDDTTATWSGASGGLASVVNISPGNEQNAGVWRILNPFGNTLVTTLRLTALAVGNPQPSGSANSDFAFRSLATSVPEPATFALVGVGLAGLGFAVRRRREMTAAA